MFDAIVISNGWDDATAALQLPSHLEGDERGSVSPGNLAGVASRTGGCTDDTLWLAVMTGGLSVTIWDGSVDGTGL